MGIMARLPDEAVVAGEVKQAMQYFQQSRQAYIQAHEQNFTAREKSHYQSDWYANYELSDYMVQQAQNGRFDPSRVFFLRYNQWPERGDAKHEEAVRLLEEQRFGGQTMGTKSTVNLE